MSILIKNGEIVDGTGAKGYVADILIEKDKIVKIAEDINVSNVEVIDAKGLVVSPGFIDMHSHSDATILIDPTNEEKLQQGITTEVNGNCGFGLFPVTKNEEDLVEVISDLDSVEFFIKREDVKWDSFESYCKYYNRNFGTNQVPLVAHGMLRSTVLGTGDKEITDDYLQDSAKLLGDEINSGAWGMSTGLAYAPGCFASFDELKSYCMELKNYNKIFASHIRDEGDYLIESVDEIINLAATTGCKAHISHLKVMGVINYPKLDIVIDKLQEARRHGVNITADIYPYMASCTMLSVLLPKEVRKKSTEDLVTNLKDEKFLEKIKEEVLHNLDNRGGSEKIRINYLRHIYKEYDVKIVGKTLKEISEIFELGILETIYKLIIDSRNIITAVYYSVCGDGIIKLMNQDFVVFGTDGVVNFNDKSVSHPRTYGAFPKVIATYVREMNAISLEKAIKKMTLDTAKIIGLEKRGVIKEGFYADIVIFDKNKIKDNGNFIYSYKYATGIDYVIVNGNISFKDHAIQKKLSGRILKST